MKPLPGTIAYSKKQDGRKKQKKLYQKTLKKSATNFTSRRPYSNHMQGALLPNSVPYSITFVCKDTSSYVLPSSFCIYNERKSKCNSISLKWKPIPTKERNHLNLCSTCLLSNRSYTLRLVFLYSIITFTGVYGNSFSKLQKQKNV